MDWQPIENYTDNDDYPRGVLLYRPSAPHWLQVAPGHWVDQAFHQKPRPYWTCPLGISSAGVCRANVPTHFMPMPEPPKLTA